MSEKTLAEMTWKEIPATTPMYEILEGIGFPEPMCILRILNKGKKTNLSPLLSFMLMSKMEFQKLLYACYKFFANNGDVRKYLMTHPQQAAMLFDTWKQFNEEPISVAAARSVNEWRKLLVQEGIWDDLMRETPLTLLGKITNALTGGDYLNVPLGEYYAKTESALESASLRSLAQKFVEADDQDRRMSELRANIMESLFGDLI